MKFTATPITGVWEVEVEPLGDERGFFGRTWCAREFAERGLNGGLAQCSISLNRRRGTLRGMHWQAAPHEEAKLVRVTQGAIWDVALDLRRDSPSYLRWYGVELSAANRRALYIPEGCAHGFQTLADDTEVFYQISVPYEPAAGRGLRWNDPRLAITWPVADPLVGERDAGLPLLGDGPC